LVLHQQAGDKFANDHAVLKDDDASLLDSIDSAFSHFVSKGISEIFSTNPGPSALATLKAHPMIRPVGGCNNRASPSSPLIPLHPP
jgi:hypothetical protein